MIPLEPGCRSASPAQGTDLTTWWRLTGTSLPALTDAPHFTFTGQVGVRAVGGLWTGGMRTVTGVGQGFPTGWFRRSTLADESRFPARLVSGPGAWRSL